MSPRSSGFVVQVANLSFIRQIGNLPHVLVVFLAVAGMSLPADAQPAGRGGMVPGGGSGSRTVPTASYHSTFANFYDGDYRSALDRFQSDARGAIKTVNARWIDSICYETMIGECYFQTGANAEANEHFAAALNLFLANSTWFSNVVPQQIRADNGGRKQPPWQVRRLLAPLGQLPATMLIQMGQYQLAQPGQAPSSGVAQMPQLFPIEPYEIIRCTCLALRRRAELLGPLAAHDPVLDNVIAALQRPAGHPNHWSEAWINLELGAALAAGGRNAAAVPALQKAALASGEFEHQLSGIAQLELGRLAMTAGDYANAAQHFEEATYDAYYFTDPLRVPDIGLMEEAFRLGALNHILANGKGVFPPLAAATAWAKATHFRALYVSLLTLAAEDHIILGQTQQAEALLDEARGAMGNRMMAVSRVAARRAFLQATALYQTHTDRKTTEGDSVLAKVMPFLRNSSLRLFQIQKADDYYTSGGKGGVSAAREAVDLYKEVLRDPQPIDWMTDPMESLAMLSVPHELPFGHWFDAAVARKDHELAMEVADRARRHRFLSTLPMGGRLESLRWVLEAPKDLMPQQAVLQRQDLLVHYPIYKTLHDQAEDLRRAIASMPLAPEDVEKSKKLGQLMNALADVGRKQEIVLREIALRREPALLAFPPLRTTAEIQKSLLPGHALLVFFSTSNNLHAFLLNREKYADWQVGATPQAIARMTAALLRKMGNVSANYELTSKDLVDGRWRKDAGDLLDALLKGTREVDLGKKFDELTIVPDGALWYLPFDALQVRADGQLQPLISRFRIRYAPTAGLATAMQEFGHRRGNTAIVSGKFSPKLDDDVVDAAVKELCKSLQGCVTVKMPLPAPAPVYATAIDRLVVLDDLSPAAESDPYGWSPIPVERAKNSGPLSDWFPLPRRGPDEMILPGFHAATEASLKRIDTSRRTSKSDASARAEIRPGDEIFLSLCGLMSTGTRTILLSRWRSGGQSSLDLIREFTQELPHTTPADAWQRAVQVVSNGPLVVESEPRIKKTTSDQPTSDASPHASHPFFWAGYMLVDQGSPAEKDKK
jgi:tetratricopeptide (TPR) repeat protein